MANKKKPGRFTIQFNTNDPQQQMAADILERQGRRKAQYIANAIWYYAHCAEGIDAATMPMMDDKALELLVLNILKKQGIGRVEQMNSCESPRAKEQVQIESSVDNRQEAAFDDFDLAAIANTLSAFQQD